MAQVERKTRGRRPSTDAEISAAAQRGRLEMKRDGARAVAYDHTRDELQITLHNGVTTHIPRTQIPGLERATGAELQAVALSPLTTSIVFERVDADYSVQGLLRSVLGLNEQQRRAGSAISPEKRTAATRNGAGGGRPRQGDKKQLATKRKQSKIAAS